MANLISKESFEVVRANKVLIRSVKNHNGFAKTFKSGYAIKDLRNGKLISMQDDGFYALQSKKAATQAISKGLYEGFTHFLGAEYL